MTRRFSLYLLGKRQRIINCSVTQGKQNGTSSPRYPSDGLTAAALARDPRAPALGLCCPTLFASVALCPFFGPLIACLVKTWWSGYKCPGVITPWPGGICGCLGCSETCCFLPCVFAGGFTVKKRNKCVLDLLWKWHTVNYFSSLKTKKKGQKNPQQIKDTNTSKKGMNNISSSLWIFFKLMCTWVWSYNCFI